MSVLRLILGDQLSTSLSSLRDYQPGDTLLMCELKQETQCVRHHKKKLVFVLSAMRHFSRALQDWGFSVRYFTLDDALTSFTEAVHCALQENTYSRVVVTHPGEWRVLAELKTLQQQLTMPLEIREDDRFLCTQQAFAHWAEGKKQLRMEFFYREMRKRYSILMEGKQPVGGQWNYDSQNRKSLPDDIQPPEPCQFKPDTITQEVMALVDQHFPHNFGSTQGFSYGIDQTQAEKVLSTFIEQRLGLFGDYQDAMKTNQPWLFHSHLGLYLNIGLLTPLQVIQQAETAYRKGAIPLNAAEGFIRQVLGWREYVRGIYWLKMPDYAKLNTLHATRHLPDFYWHGETKMHCLSECVNNTRDNAYAHHIQRLMVLGNFSLLAGINPSEVSRWFLEVYADAYE
ncbi:cryptochrome/photolyase family protein [Oceanospirillum beijerinckii]|uniref:cryptochrome/photolyase family protein n=1 Tax=Oceanospirillum beijerinckii TaxID=64976 RepID=UPI000402AF19|nr:cryptochrome/photolyase family protein [Oceanospirillum beijerinckii]